jgi:hypothetical protein
MSRLPPSGRPPSGSTPGGLPVIGHPLSGPPPGGLPRDWLPALVKFLDREPAVIRIVVAEVRGSTPREPGAFMLVGRDGLEGSIASCWQTRASPPESIKLCSAPMWVSAVVVSCRSGWSGLLARV